MWEEVVWGTLDSSGLSLLQRGFDCLHPSNQLAKLGTRKEITVILRVGVGSPMLAYSTTH